MSLSGNQVYVCTKLEDADDKSAHFYEGCLNKITLATQAQPGHEDRSASRQDSTSAKYEEMKEDERGF